MKDTEVRNKFIIHILSSILTVSLIISIFFIIENYIHMKDDLLKHQKDYLQKVSTILETEFSGYISVLQQINSRTMIRIQLEEYLLGKVSVDELREFSIPKLKEALNKVSNCVYFTRIDSRNQSVVELGVRPPGLLDFFPEFDTYISKPFIINSEYMVYGYSKIFSDTAGYIGYDLAVFNINSIKKILDTEDRVIFISSNDTVLLSNRIYAFGDKTDFKKCARANYIFTNTMKSTGWDINILERKAVFYKPIISNILKLSGIVVIIIAAGLLFSFHSTRFLIGKVIFNTRELQKEIDEKTAVLSKELAMKDRIYSILAHDLKSPIAGVFSFIDMILKDWKITDENVKITHLTYCRHALENQVAFINNILQWVRCSHASLDEEIIDVSDIVRREIGFYSGMSALKNITIRNYYEKSFLISANPQVIETIIRNILSNALKFTPVYGTITVKTESVGGKVLLSVTDTGIGMTQEEIAVLLKNEFNRSKSGTNGEMGTGFGIGLIRNFIERSKGSLSIISSPGEGTIVEVRFPEISC